MLLLNSLLICLCLQSFQTPVDAAALALDSSLRLYSRARPDPIPGYRPPPEPWNDEICRNVGLPGLYLTFSWGAVLSKNAIAALLNTSKRIISKIIQDGHGDDRLAPYFGNLVIPYVGLVLTVRPFQDRTLTYNNIYSAVGLLESCGYFQGEREEMWSYIFTPAGRIGLITLTLGR